MSDTQTTIGEIKEQLLKFKQERNWGQFHDAKNLAEAIVIESGELLEHFLWKSPEEINSLLKADKKYREEVGEELADIIIYCLNFANATDIDISTIIKDKILKNGKKYPVEKAKEGAKKNNQW